MVRHQAPGPHLDGGAAALLGEQVALERIVAVAEEGPRAAIAARGDMVGMTGDDNTGEANVTETKIVFDALRFTRVGDGEPPGDPPPDSESSGCAVGTDAGWLIVALLGLLLRARRR